MGCWDCECRELAGMGLVGEEAYGRRCSRAMVLTGDGARGRRCARVKGQQVRRPAHEETRLRRGSRTERLADVGSPARSLTDGEAHRWGLTDEEAHQQRSSRTPRIPRTFLSADLRSESATMFTHRPGNYQAITRSASFLLPPLTSGKKEHRRVGQTSAQSVCCH